MKELKKKELKNFMYFLLFMVKIIYGEYDESSGSEKRR